MFLVPSVASLTFFEIYSKFKSFDSPSNAGNRASTIVLLFFPAPLYCCIFLSPVKSERPKCLCSLYAVADAKNMIERRTPIEPPPSLASIFPIHSNNYFKLSNGNF